VGRALPITAVSATIAAASMAGVIPLLGFVAKESALEAALHHDGGIGVTTVLITLGAVLTTAYGIRFIRGAFLRKRPDELIDGAVGASEVEPPARSFEAPAALLAVLTVVFGAWVVAPDALVVGGSGALAAAAGEFHLKLWHGLGTSLGLSTLALVAGAMLWRWPGSVRELVRLTERVPQARSAYRAWLRGLNELADRTVAIVQPGSLPIYVGVILLTVVALPGSALLRGVALGAPPASSSPLQVVVVVGVVGAALGVATVRTRLSAVLLLGGVGFGIAVLFVLQGAPDLALTQLLIETLALGIFVLVLRRLPESFRRSSWRLGRGIRIVVSLAVGALVTVLALAATSARTVPGPATEFLARAEPEGGGKNVVNVILTDFRALDTLGEVTVLVVAAVGVLSIVRSGRWRDDEESAADPADEVAEGAGTTTEVEP